MSRSVRELLRTTHVSYSKLQTYEQCPMRFKLQYLEKYETEPSRAIQLGSLVHTVIARYMQEIQGQPRTFAPTLTALAQHIEPARNELVQRGELRERIDDGEVNALLATLSGVLPKIDGRSVLYVETEREVQIGPYRFKSILDLVLAEPADVIHVIDFKTGKPQYVSNDQLRAYALAILTDPAHRIDSVRLSYLFLKDGSLRSFDLHRHECAGIIDGIMSSVRTIEDDDDFEPNVTRLCDWCGVRDYCKAYG